MCVCVGGGVTGCVPTRGNLGMQLCMCSLHMARQAENNCTAVLILKVFVRMFIPVLPYDLSAEWNTIVNCQARPWDQYSIYSRYTPIAII